MTTWSSNRHKHTCKWRRRRCRFNRSGQSVFICRQWYEECKRYQPHADCKERQHL